MLFFASLRDLELRILHWVNCDGESALADGVADFANDLLFGIPLVVLLLLIVATTARGRSRLGRVVLAMILALGMVHAVRELVWRVAPRGRPGTLFTEAEILRGPTARATCADHPEMWVERGHPPKEASFPSSHVITAAAAAAALTAAAWWAGLLGWLYALAVGFGRLYWGKHWPSDVLGSLVLGAAAGWAAWKIAGRLEALRTARLRETRERRAAAP